MITRGFERKLLEQTKRYEAKGEPVLVEVSFYGLIVAYAKGKKEAESFLDFLETLFELLDDRLSDSEKLLIRGSITGVFSNIDLKYLNFVGELAVLNHFKQNITCVLGATEYPHDLKKPNGPKIDFRLLSPGTADALLVEVVNIRIYEASIWGEAKIKNVITQKISEKLGRKGIRKEANFLLIPVLWGSYEDIQSIMSFYERDQPKFQNTSIPFGYVAFRDQSGKASHLFGPIDRVLNELK